MSTLKDFTLESGGALGADSYFDILGESYGITRNHYYHGKKTAKGNILITDAQLEEGWQHVLEANKTLFRRPDNYRSLLSRNWFQVKPSGEIFAVATLQDKKIVSGGTGWAVQMAIDNWKVVYLYEQNFQKWMTFNYQEDIFEDYDGTPYITSKHFAGIGTRNINIHGIRAIKELYKNTVKKIKET